MVWGCESVRIFSWIVGPAWTWTTCIEGTHNHEATVRNKQMKTHQTSLLKTPAPPVGWLNGWSDGNNWHEQQSPVRKRADRNLIPPAWNTSGQVDKDYSSKKSNAILRCLFRNQWPELQHSSPFIPFWRTATESHFFRIPCDQPFRWSCVVRNGCIVEVKPSELFESKPKHGLSIASNSSSHDRKCAEDVGTKKKHRLSIHDA